jgi:hypothetical protein
LIGLLFAEFQIFVIDSIVAILIALVIIYEGLEALLELIQAGDDLSVDTIHLTTSEAYDDLITSWMLAQLARDHRTEGELNSAFTKGISIGYRYYDVHAIIGFRHWEDLGLTKHIQTAKRSGLIEESNGILSITTNGLSMYYKNRVKEMKHLSKRFTKERSKFRSAAYMVFGWTTFILLMLFGESLYLAFMTFLHALIGI